MKLDKRIIEGKKPLTYFDIEEAKHFIGRKGYFSDNVTYFANLNDAGIATLGMVNDSDWNYPFMATGQFSGRARYFLPEEWVQEQEPEPVWKPYDIESWEKQYDIGDTVEYRRKELELTRAVAYLGYERNTSGKILILLGDLWYTFEELFENYEIHDYRYNNNHRVEWRSFGYQE